MDEDHHFTRTIACQDAGGRDKELRVLAEPGFIFLLAPPGEVARLLPPRIEELKQALTDALVFAVRRQP